MKKKRKISSKEFHLVLQPDLVCHEEDAAEIAHSLSIFVRTMNPKRTIGILMYIEDKKKTNKKKGK